MPDRKVTFTLTIDLSAASMALYRDGRFYGYNVPALQDAVARVADYIGDQAGRRRPSMRGSADGEAGTEIGTWNIQETGPHPVGRIDPATEAGALVSEWVDTYRRTDDGSWRAPYTAEEAAAVATAIDELIMTLPAPGLSLWFRTPPPEEAPPE